jgi:hypothetical protein
MTVLSLYTTTRTLFRTTRSLFRELLSRSPTSTCVEGIQKKLVIFCHFTTHNIETDLKTNDETNTFLICLFVLSEQLDLSLSTFLKREASHDTFYPSSLGKMTMNSFRKAWKRLCAIICDNG